MRVLRQLDDKQPNFPDRASFAQNLPMSDLAIAIIDESRKIFVASA